MNKNITWKELKALDDLYHLKKTRASIQEHPYIKYLLEDKCILDRKSNNIKIIIATDDFEKFYEESFKIQYEAAKSFLLENGIEPTAKKSFTLEDVKTLMLIAENKIELKGNPTNIEDFSNEFFDTSKYLKNKASIRNAVFKILDITEFPLDQKENQWRLVVDIPNPKAIVLCENKSFMKQPWIAKNTQIKMWYVGGNNIKIIDDIDEIELSKPIYYSCDWDLAGLQIYSRIKAKLRNRNKDISLLYPNEPHKKISTYIDYHYSHWVLIKKLSGLPIEIFSKKELILINNLIQNETWIEEESFNLEKMLQKLEV
jgi:5S rRNA maturation endonuclease (ribonuclease M5)